jgi:hypothetical protein
MDSTKLVRGLLIWFLGPIGSFIINHTSLKPSGWSSRTFTYVWAPLVTFGIYGVVGAICNLTFDPSKAKNIGYKKD